ncbi:hypothetical protein COW98_01965 [Candidatus Roizmanbacteria bacterium CG22_combo_CG10-13_8_21_14_all_35_9]|uniref:EF-hand domain-containing protein n=5 Tax=Patescibacteria group TaxID=1783273 RepID=A0A1J4TAC8_9BACT|nr:MAG: hypothetical protein AUJ27_02955 [Candidatus Falkowbacteria bacterium CG1_02_37_44]PIP15044.1 MAG: hypothetical protein COX47_01880 [Candidatus Roizmanbacteria bacterium CG23_combo_of_CG06-09_8_20_14_all_35_49]PIP62826.1 MAG: hypothetical protein COW98_01965 [Candidatus Roizmanbacteria bacterium CG22_combo_CG10-13_8_21_14_all_35_9]PJC33250.1 MAG: hypothetical protein CO048_03500 [Candidatus Roizmanbacteria bacterium CG_4_9_14_0_2_um_filter_35_15]
MLKKITTLIILVFILINVSNIYANPNNKYGIHLAQPHLEDLDSAAKLVNSTGGDWGYITLIIQENDRNREKWQRIFNRLRELHLIPIIRLATQSEGENWRRPEEKDADDWVKFLDSLNWVVKNRYIVLFNEPNHGLEWGGEVDEKSYAEVAFTFAKALKEKDQDFFVMLAGFDASAPSWPSGMEDEEIFLRKIFNFSFLIFNYIDGWVSHSYPNPNFSGSPWASGRGTVRTYDWELALLGRLGVNKELPVFITETGWKRGSEEGVAENFRSVYENVWQPDDRVMVVTPFVFDYQSDPFLEFSWKKYQSSDFYQQYYTVQSLLKTKGEPEQIEKGSISFDLPKELVAQSKYNFRVSLKNQGQAVWDKNESYELGVMSYEGNKLTNFLISDIKDIKPFEEKTIDFSLKTNEEKEKEEIKFFLVKDNKTILESKPWQFKILPLPDLNVEVNFWPIRRAKGDNFEVQLFDVDERLVFKKTGVKVDKGLGMIKNIQNIAIDELYRVVILKPGYLPRQTYIVFKTKGNLAKFKSMLPFDLNSDGKFDFRDVKFLFYHLTKLLKTV